MPLAVAHDLIAGGRLVRPLDCALPMKQAYCLISPEGSLINPVEKASKAWLMRQIKAERLSSGVRAARWRATSTGNFMPALELAPLNQESPDARPTPSLCRCRCRRDAR